MRKEDGRIHNIFKQVYFINRRKHSMFKKLIGTNCLFMMKAITFLGTGKYSETTYFYEEKFCTTDLFPTAVYEFFHPEVLLVFVTEQAKEMHWNRLVEKLSGRIQPTAVDIPQGKSEEELWRIFDIVADSIEEKESVVFDITHAFRSLPLIVFIAATYLRAAKSIELEAIVYGAYEARNEETNQTPVFNLSPFVNLLDWTSATDKFLKTGNAEELAALLKQAHRLPYQLGLQKEQGDLPKRLQNAANALEKVSQVLSLVRPTELMEQSMVLQRYIGGIESEAVRWAKPFNLLLEKTRRDYKPFALENPLERKQLKSHLAIQLRLIHWYVDRQQFIQAVTLAREWLVSLVGYRLGKALLEERSNVEDVLNKYTNILQQKTIESESEIEPSPDLAALKNLSDAGLIREVWNQLSDLRNDVAHTGMRKDPRPIAAIIKATQELLPRLDVLAGSLIF